MSEYSFIDRGNSWVGGIETVHLDLPCRSVTAIGVGNSGSSFCHTISYSSLSSRVHPVTGIRLSPCMSALASMRSAAHPAIQNNVLSTRLGLGADDDFFDRGTRAGKPGDGGGEENMR